MCIIYFGTLDNGDRIMEICTTQGGVGGTIQVISISEC